MAFIPKTWVDDQIVYAADMNRIEQGIAAVETGKAPLTHAAQHASGGTDPITPASIGAANLTHAAQHASGGTDPITPASIGAVSEWTLVQEYRAAGKYTWTAPDLYGGASYKIGVYMVGGGGGGAADRSSGSATGGAAGYGCNLTFDVSPGDTFQGVVGAGGGGGSYRDPDAPTGGTTSFNGHTIEGGLGGHRSSGSVNNGADGGQGSTASYGRTPIKMFGSSGAGAEGGSSQSPTLSQNAFDRSMVTLCAGGYATSSRGQVMIAMPDGTKGGNGKVSASSITGEYATGNGNGGGAAYSSSSTAGVSGGAGSPGMVLIYAKAV